MTGDSGPLRTTSLRLRTVVAIVVLLAVLLAGLAVAVEVLLGIRLRAQAEDRLRDRASAAAALVGTVDAEDLADRLSAQGLSVRIVGPDGGAVDAGPTPDQLRTGPPDPGGLPATVPRGSGLVGGTAPTAAATPTTTADGATISSSTVREGDGVLTLVSRLDDGTRITLTVGTRDVQDTLVQLGWVMGGASAAFLGVAVLGVVLVVRRSLRPLDEMATTARSIAGGDRGRRLRPSRQDTEIGRVAVAMDEMLDAVEGAEREAVAAEGRVRSFLSDAAHELRTPVAGVRAAADTLVRGVGDVATREVLAVHVVRQADRAARLVEDMLTMARLDRGSNSTDDRWTSAPSSWRRATGCGCGCRPSRSRSWCPSGPCAPTSTPSGSPRSSPTSSTTPPALPDPRAGSSSRSTTGERAPWSGWRTTVRASRCRTACGSSTDSSGSRPLATPVPAGPDWDCRSHGASRRRTAGPCSTPRTAEATRSACSAVRCSSCGCRRRSRGGGPASLEASRVWWNRQTRGTQNALPHGVRVQVPPLVQRMLTARGAVPAPCPATRTTQHPASSRLAAVSDTEATATAPRRVVVAEDESLIRLDIVEILRDNGFDVVGEAGDGETAVQLATDLRPDLVVMDVKMPQLDGISAAEKLSKNHIAPVVLLTAFSQKDLVERATEAGALAYVVKPFTPNDLLPAIEIALSRHQQIITLEAEVADLVERFETRKLVDRAKGLLNEKMGLTEPEAFRWIQKASMDRRLTMHDVAKAIIEQLSARSSTTRRSHQRRRTTVRRRCCVPWRLGHSVRVHVPTRHRSIDACSVGVCGRIVCVCMFRHDSG